MGRMMRFYNTATEEWEWWEVCRVRLPWESWALRLRWALRRRLSRPRWRIDRRTLAYRDTRAERFARIAHAVKSMIEMQKLIN